MVGLFQNSPHQGVRMSNQSSDDPEDFISLRDLAKIAKKAKAKSYNSPGASDIRVSYLNICDTQDWSYSTPMPTLQFSNAARCM